jgi:hypothetical protein
MKPTIVRAAVSSALIVAGGGLALGTSGGPKDGDDGKFVYAVNVLCQFSGGTSINIHNPNERTVTFTKKGIPLQFGQVATPPQAQQNESLKSDWALLMGCDDIVALGGVGPGGAGNVIIDSKRELDVWAVYTSIVAGGGIGETRGPVRVPATKVNR